MSMPPVPSWYQGRAAIGAFFERFVFSDEGPGHHRLVPIRANRQPAFAIYNRAPGETVYSAFALLLLRVEDDAIAELNGFVLPRLFPRFGLPPILEP
jgi:RNA polymerase sigma-70 factor, ECF subfamily